MGSQHPELFLIGNQHPEATHIRKKLTLEVDFRKQQTYTGSRGVEGRLT